jgi:hypothetical protein
MLGARIAAIAMFALALARGPAVAQPLPDVWVVPPTPLPPIVEPQKPRFPPSTTAKTWLGVQLETQPSGSIDVTTNGSRATMDTQLGFGVGGYLERRLVGSNLIVGVAPRLITPVGIKGVNGSGNELDVRMYVAVGGELVRNVHGHVVGTLGYSWLLHAIASTDPSTGAVSYYTSRGVIAGIGVRIAYTLTPRLLAVTEVSYQFGSQSGAHVATPTPIDLGVSDRYMTLGFGVARAID